MLVSLKHIIQRWLGTQLTRLGLPASYLEFPWPTLSDGTPFPREWFVFSPGTYLGMYQPHIDPTTEVGRATSLKHFVLLKILVLLDLIQNVPGKMRAVGSFFRLKSIRRKLVIFVLLALGLFVWFASVRSGTAVQAKEDKVDEVELDEVVERYVYPEILYTTNAVYNYTKPMERYEYAYSRM